MTIAIPNCRVVIENEKGTSKMRFCPKYEVPLIEALFAKSAPGGQSPNIVVDEVPKHLRKACGTTQVHSLLSEKQRLAKVYEFDPRTKDPVFARVYPVTLFEDTARRLYPDVFGAIPGHSLGSSAQEETKQYEPPVTPPGIDEDKIDELTQLKHVNMSRAHALVLAGYAGVDEIAQTDPADLLAIDGMTAKEADAIVEHAIELAQGAETAADFLSE